MNYKKIPDSRTARLFAVLCSVVYGGAYLTRLSFAAVTVGIIEDLGCAKSEISIVTTMLFITYGAFQVVSGYLGDKIKPNLIMFGGLVISSVLNLVIPFCHSITMMTIVWGINGVAQSMLWPPIVKLTASYLTSKDYQDSSVIISWGSAVGTVLLYLLSSLCVAISGWRTVFFVCAASGMLIAVSFALLFPRFVAYADKYGIEDDKLTTAKTIDVKPKTKMPPLLLIVTGVILLAIVMMGVLRDSISTWMPTYISETYDLGSSSSILTGIIIPIFNIFLYPLTLAYYRKFFKNELTCAMTLYLMCCLATILLYFVSDVNPILSVIILALVCVSMHGANFLLIGLVPKRYEKFGNIGLMSGILNAFVYVGSSISIWGIASIAERSGWQTTTLIWGACALVGALLCLTVIKPWNRLFAKNK